MSKLFIFLSFEKKSACLGFDEIDIISSYKFKYFRTLAPFGEIDIPAPYSLISVDFSKIIKNETLGLSKI